MAKARKKGGKAARARRRVAKKSLILGKRGKGKADELDRVVGGRAPVATITSAQR
jgi:hypothetical protein